MHFTLNVKWVHVIIDLVCNFKAMHVKIIQLTFHAILLKVKIKNRIDIYFLNRCLWMIHQHKDITNSPKKKISHFIF